MTVAQAVGQNIDWKLAYRKFGRGNFRVTHYQSNASLGYVHKVEGGYAALGKNGEDLGTYALRREAGAAVWFTVYGYF